VNPESEVPQPGRVDYPTADCDRRPSLAGGLFSWVLLLAIAVFGLALVAARLPPIAKKLGLLAVAYGLLVGLIASWLTQFAPGFRARRRLGMATVFVVAIAGQIGIGVESYRLDRSEQESRERSDPKNVLARRLLDSANEPSDPKSRATFDEFRRNFSRPGPSFGDYLQFRVSGIGIQSTWTAALFWGAEVVLGGVAASWIYSRSLGRPLSGRALTA
jgi:hypothetical protein